jgi:hypothetical protein
MTGFYVATEDALSEAVAERLILEENYGLFVMVKLGRKGNDYLRRNFPAFTKIAQSIPFLLLTDLDRAKCPADLIPKWYKTKERPKRMLFRVVVREIEAWLLADRQGFAQFSGVPPRRIPEHPESLEDPKVALLNLVRRYGKKSVKADILPEKGSTARVGFVYNQALCAFVQEAWSPDRAEMIAESLKRARKRLHEMRLSLERCQ